MATAHGRRVSFALAALLLSTFSLGGGTDSIAGSSLMDAGAQAAPPKTSIFNSPPKREEPVMTPDERLKLQKDLAAARDRHAPDAKARAHPAPAAQPAKH